MQEVFWWLGPIAVGLWLAVAAVKTLQVWERRGNLPPRRLQTLLMLRLHGSLYPDAIGTLIGVESTHSVYRILMDLEHEGFVEYTWETHAEAVERQSGRRVLHNEMPARRQYYKLTPAGVAALSTDYAKDKLRAVQYLLMSRP